VARRAWLLLRSTIEGYIADEAMSRGAAIAYYTVFSIAPLLVIATAVAGLAFGRQAVEGAIAAELTGLLGEPAAIAVQGLIRSAARPGASEFATLVGVVVLLVTASGVFGELQAALNAIWQAEPPPGRDTVSTFLRARALSLGLVAATGFLLLCSLLVSAGLAALGTWAGGWLPGWTLLLAALNNLASFLVVTLLFAAIYKVLPDRPLSWRDVGVGALMTAFLFTIGKSLIGWYIGSSAVSSAYGATGALMVVLLWVYYSAQIFLLGAEFTRAWAGLRPAAPAPTHAAPARPMRRRHPVGGLLPAAALGTALLALLRRRR
jgi:membrane protein